MNIAANNQIFDSVPNFFNGRKINIDQKIFLWELGSAIRVMIN